MDGYAVIHNDIISASKDNPVELTVIGDIPAGSAPQSPVTQGKAMRIMTGAPLPDGADTVVQVELTNANFRSSDTALPETVLIYSSVPQRSSIRYQGEDFKKGQELIQSGTRVHPKNIGLLAQLGRSNLKVYRLPKIALFTTGDELLTVDSPIEPGKIRDTNSYSLSALIKDCGAEVID
jgi:molybdopterin molybdotransferase